MKGRKNKKKGFTITELLVTIIILSILTVIVIGSVVKLLDNSKKKYYSSQENMMVLAGKEYFTNYRSKLPKKIANIEKVSLKTLVDEKYIDSIQDKNNKACNVDNSYIYAQKRGEEDFQYYAYLECSDYQTGKDDSKPVITFLPNEKKANSKITVKMRVSDNEGGDLFYQYEIEKDGNTELIEPEEMYTGEKEIPLGGEIRADEKAEYQLTGYATDSSGNEAVKKSGKYIVDKNEPPEIESFSIRSTTSSYHNLNTYLTLKLKDNSNGTIKICVSNTGYDKNCVWNDTVSSGYSTSSKTWNVGGSYDGGKRTIYLTAKDNNGNTARKKISYTVYENCLDENISRTDTYGSCSASCGYSGVQNKHTVKTDSNTGASCGVTNVDVACNRRDCCSSTYVSGGYWTSCSNSCGSGSESRYNYLYSNYNDQYCGSEYSYSSSCYSSSGCPVESCTESNRTYGSCSNRCGTGTRSVTIYYKNGCASSRTTTESCSDYSGCSSSGGSSGGSSSSGSAPTCSLSTTSSPNSNDWFKTKPTVTMTISGNATTKGIGTSRNSTNGNTSYTVTTEGTTTVYGYVKNSSGSNSCSLQVKFDKTAPTKPTVSITPTGCTTGKVTMEASSSDSTSGVDHYKSYHNGGSATFDGTLKLEKKQEGTASVEAYDKAGNVSKQTTSAKITIKKSCGSGGGSSSSGTTMYTCRYGEPNCNGRTNGWTEWHPTKNLNDHNGSTYNSNTKLTVTCSGDWCQVVGQQRYIKKGCLSSTSGTCCTYTACPG